MGGRLKAKQTVLSGVSFGKGTRDITVLLLPSPVPEVLPGIDGVIGIAPLKARRVNFDFVGRTFTFECNVAKSKRVTGEVLVRQVSDYPKLTGS